MELLNVQGVQIGAVVPEGLVVSLPLGHRIVPYTAGVQNGLPQLLHGLAGPDAGEQLLGPGLAGHGGDAPLVLVLHLVPVALDDGVAGLHGLGHLGLVDAVETVGIVGLQEDTAGQHVGIVLPAGFLILVHLVEAALGAIAVVQLLQGLVVPVHHHLAGLALIALLHQHLHELRLVQAGADKYLLARLDVHAHAGDQLGILAQYGLLHVFLASCFFIDDGARPGNRLDAVILQ